MGLQSLRDKLLQAGLVTQEQAKKSEADQAARKAAAKDRRQKPQQGPRKPEHRTEHRPAQPKREPTPEQLRAREEEAAFRERERELNREREENRKRAVEDRKRLETLRAIAEKHEIAERGDEAFHFTSRKRKVLRIYLSADQLAQLQNGELAIMDKPLPSELAFSLVPREAAEQALQADPKALRFYNRGNGETYGFKADPTEEAAETEEAEAAPAEEAPESAEG